MLALSNLVLGTSLQGKMGNVRFLWSKLSLLIPQKTCWVGLNIEYIGDPMCFPQNPLAYKFIITVLIKIAILGYTECSSFCEHILESFGTSSKAFERARRGWLENPQLWKDQNPSISSYHIVIVGHYTMQILNPSHFNLPGSKSFYIIFPQSSPRNPKFHGMFSHVWCPTLAIFSHETLEDLEVSTL